MRASLKILDPTCNYCFSSNENSDDGLEDVSGMLHATMLLWWCV